ncbi:MAG TPA: hypothetical protein VJ654_17060 [Noviherbaspirillum sp.]|nr:hypothetical protein [Noviherbaspirillum sp.]
MTPRFRFKDLLMMCAVSLGLHCSAHASAVVPIDTMPRPGDSIGNTGGFVDYMWSDIAVGFRVATAGRITHIDTLLSAFTNYEPFVIGLASNDLIGHAPLDYIYAPPGSIQEWSVCSYGPYPPTMTGCAWPGSANFRLAQGQTLAFDTDIFLPEAGTYWLYSRFPTELAGFNWTTNLSETTDLFATRRGISTTNPSATTFNLVENPVYAPAMRIEFEPGLRVSEPPTGSIILAGLAFLMYRRRSAGGNAA